MPDPTSGGYDWQPTKPVNVQVMPAPIEVNVTAIAATPDVNVVTMPAVVTVNLPAADLMAALMGSEIKDIVGSIQTVDRAGKIFMSEGFETGMGCWSVTGAGSYVAFLTRRNRKNGLQAFSVFYPTYTASCVITRRFALPTTLKLGFEASFCIPTAYYSLLLHPYHYNAGTKSSPGVWFNFSTKILYIYNAALGYTAVETIPAYTAGNSYWYTIKMVYDIATGYYCKCLFNNYEIDLTAYQFAQAAATGIHQECQISMQGILGASANAVTYLDDILLTEEV